MDYDSDKIGDYPVYDEARTIDHPFLGKLQIPKGFTEDKDEIIKALEEKYKSLEEKYKSLKKDYDEFTKEANK